MANWIGVARTNYVEISDMPGLLAFLEGSGIQIVKGKSDLHCFLPDPMSDDGVFPTRMFWRDDDEEGDEIEFSWQDVMPFIREGDVLVVMTSGFENLRYITGHAEAYVRSGGETRSVGMSIDDIYDKAVEAFAPARPITAAEY